MKSRTFLASLLAGAIGMCVVTVGEPRSATADGVKGADQPPLEKTDRPLADLKQRCQKMLEMQIAVHDAIEGLHKGKKPSPEHKEVSLKLADKQKGIITEATKAIDMLKADGAAVGVTEVLQELRETMKRLQGRLESGDVGSATQTAAGDIIDTLKEIIAALKNR